MKKFISVLIIAVFFFVSCEKESEKESPCPVVTAKDIPGQVTFEFNKKYPAAFVITWFNKDGKGYSAYFINNGKKTITQFDNNGTFIKEEIKDHHQEGQHHDEDEGCECEID